MVVGIHRGLENRAVCPNCVPSFPDRGRAVLDLVEPARDVLLQKERGRKTRLADLEESRQESGGADEARADPSVRAGNGRLEVLDARRQNIGRDEVVKNGQGVRRLVVVREPARSGHESWAKACFTGAARSLMRVAAASSPSTEATFAVRSEEM